MDANAMRMGYAGAIGLLCELSVHVSDRYPSEQAEYLDNIERCVADWCALTGWKYKRILHRIEVFPS